MCESCPHKPRMYRWSFHIRGHVHRNYLLVLILREAKLIKVSRYVNDYFRCIVRLLQGVKLRFARQLELDGYPHSGSSFDCGSVLDFDGSLQSALSWGCRLHPYTTKRRLLHGPVARSLYDMVYNKASVHDVGYNVRHSVWISSGNS